MDDGNVFARKLAVDREVDEEFEPEVRGWPKKPEEILARTVDGMEPNEEVSARMEGEGTWERVWTLREVENVYDLGFVGNVRDVFLKRRVI